MGHSNHNYGLSAEEAINSRKQHGSNMLDTGDNRVIWRLIRGIMLEPMFILLLTAASLYFVMHAWTEGIIMLAAIFIVAGISFFQDYRSRNAVQALRKLSAAQATVIRNGEPVRLPAEEVVVNDILLVKEGEIVAADGSILLANDFSLNESILTGEAFPVAKPNENSDLVYKGTLVNSGSATIRITAVGQQSQFGKIGLSLQRINIPPTPLQQQIRGLVRHMLWAGAFVFLMVLGFHYHLSGNFLFSLMQGLTLAMSILPEEIPVAFSTFQALGAYRLLKENIVVKEPQYVETLGSATVICTDKTGTLTLNQMSIDWVYDAVSGQTVSATDLENLPEALLEMAMWSSESDPFDPMEKAIHQLYGRRAAIDKRPAYSQIHEYPIGGQPPMMTHIFRNTGGDTIIAAKGAPEALLQRSSLMAGQQKQIEEEARQFARKGYRVLGVGRANWGEPAWPASQEEFTFSFLGLLVFHDPPKPLMRETIGVFQQAGITVKMITGDYAETAVAIAAAIGLNHNQQLLTGQEVMHLSDQQLQERIKHTSLFARMFPEAKLRVIDALKQNGEVVAMTGDGVNDGPALKAAHIGIAMGKRGSEVAREAAALILVDDDLQHMTVAVAQGRRIYDNLKKAVQYIVSIHIPIILIVTLPLLLAWHFTSIFSPVHVIFLELIMGPTCSILFENEPMEPGTMQRPPRKISSTFLSWRQFSISLVQGIGITLGCLGIGYYFLQQGADDELVRTVIFITLLFSNIFLTLVNRSFRYSVLRTFKNRNPRVPQAIGISLLFISGLLGLPWLRQLFELSSLSFSILAACFGTALVSTCWIEIWKLARKANRPAAKAVETDYGK